MEVWRTAADLSGLDALRGERPVVLVPTMGALHPGHLSLVREAVKTGPTVVSIFVNPTQFGPGEDLAAYPRDLAHDLALLADLDVSGVFAPEVMTIYGGQGEVTILPGSRGLGLCGGMRPGHFSGVLTVVAKLLGLIRPEVAVFGRKDAQQCLVIGQMVADLRLGVRLVDLPTVREADGLAMSSRNRYLSEPQREQALCLSRALSAARELLAAGERRVEPLLAVMRREMARADSLDYCEVRQVPDLAPVTEVAGTVLLAVAAQIGPARLIDNLVLDIVRGSVSDGWLLGPMISAAQITENRELGMTDSVAAVDAVVLAAGKGTRMKSDLPKVLHEIAGQTLLDHVLATVSEVGIEHTVVVVGHQAGLVQETCGRPGLDFVVQEPQLGTGHAVQVAVPSLRAGGHTVILAGDVPLLRADTLRRLVDGTRSSGAAAVVLTCVVADAGAYGRIVKDAAGQVLKIVEACDATADELDLGEYNTGVFCFQTDQLVEALGKLTTDNQQGEYYLTDTIAYLVAQGRLVQVVTTTDPDEVVGINTVPELDRAGVILAGRDR